MEKDNLKKGEGFVIRVQGAVVDVRFKGETPDVYEALNIGLKNGSSLVLETMFQMDNFEVRTIALGSTDGIKRGDIVVRTNAPISVPVGEKTLGRIFNVLGQPVDGLNKIEKKDCQFMPIHKPSPTLSEQKTTPEILETGIKVIDLISPFTKGGKIGIFGGAGVGKTVVVKSL